MTPSTTSSKPRGPKTTPPTRVRFTGRDIRALRRTYHTIAAANGGELTNLQRQGLKGLCNPWVRERA